MDEVKVNKVRLTLRNAHVAILKSMTGETPTYDVPIPVPGSVSLDLAPVGELTKFYADGLTYWQGEANNGYEGDWEVAQFPEELSEKIWANTKVATDNVLIEDANAPTASFALLFEIMGDKAARRYCMYNCTAKRPHAGGKTSTENKDPQPQRSTISCVPLPDGKVQAKTISTTTEAVFNDWYKKVYFPATPGVGP